MDREENNKKEPYTAKNRERPEGTVSEPLRTHGRSFSRSTLTFSASSGSVVHGSPE
ncbi:MAG: hypothetical protein ACTSP1_01575 [Candidatus Freyarchaeota archaeon]